MLCDFVIVHLISAHHFIVIVILCHPGVISGVLGAGCNSIALSLVDC